MDFLVQKHPRSIGEQYKRIALGLEMIDGPDGVLKDPDTLCETIDEVFLIHAL